MFNVNSSDVVLELVELCKEIAHEVEQQLSYYRASVYKQETAPQVLSKVEQLRLISKLIAYTQIDEAFEDFDSSMKLGSHSLPPGECVLSQRIYQLLRGLETEYNLLISLSYSKQLELDHKVLSKKIRSQRRKLLSTCKQGSRQWNLFQNF
jgi:hypothetical protein